MGVLYKVLFAIVFAVQIGLVSIYLPRRLAKAARGMSPSGLRTYVALNNTIAWVGLIALVFCLPLQFREVMTGLLLGVGLLFLVQLSTILVPVAHRALPVRRPDTSGDLPPEAPLDSVRLFDVVPRVPVGVAVLLYIAFVAVMGFEWTRIEGNQLTKIAVLTFTNVVFAAAIIWNYLGLKKSAEQAAERYRELARMAPIIIFGSILVTTYFFIKEIMFGLDLQELRPTMMSMFLQLIGIAVFHALWRVETVRLARK